MLSKSSITINNTEYIPAKEAEVTFLIAIVGIITGIIFGFFILKYQFGSATSEDLAHSVPAVVQESSSSEVYPDGPNSPLHNAGIESELESDGVKEYSI